MAHNTRQFSYEEIYDLTEQKGSVRINVDDSWRHGTRQTYVVPHEGKFWQFTVRVHTTEGWEEEPVTATEVFSTEVVITKTEWNPVVYD